MLTIYNFRPPSERPPPPPYQRPVPPPKPLVHPQPGNQQVTFTKPLATVTTISRPHYATSPVQVGSIWLNHLSLRHYFSDLLVAMLSYYCHYVIFVQISISVFLLRCCIYPPCNLS